MLSGLTILVVEDEALAVMWIEEMLEHLQCTSIVAVPTVVQALGVLDTKPIDAAMLDVNLRGEFSFPVADALTRRGVPYLFSSGYDRRGLPEGYRDCPLLTKPYEVEELAAMFARILAKED